MMYVVTNLFKELLNFKIRIVLQAYRTTHSIKHQVNETALAKLTATSPLNNTGYNHLSYIEVGIVSNSLNIVARNYMIGIATEQK